MWIECANCGENLASGDEDDPDHLEAAADLLDRVVDEGCPFCGSHELPNAE